MIPKFPPAPEPVTCGVFMEVVNVGEVRRTTPPVPVDGLLEPVPPLEVGRAVPDKPIVIVGEMEAGVMGELVTFRNEGTAIPTSSMKGREDSVFHVRRPEPLFDKKLFAAP